MLNILKKLARSFRKAKSGTTSAVILCAGLSTRFSTDGESKQMATVGNLPVIVRTVNAFIQSPSIEEIVLVVPKDDKLKYKKIVEDYNLFKVSKIVSGGATRQESALKGVDVISQSSEFVAIHDGARCLVTQEIIENVIDEARINKAATAATPMTDTVKLCDKDGFISKTMDRNYVWNVQTPQVFEKKLYMTCAYLAKEQDFMATDDCMLAENAGFKVKLVNTGKENIKITVKSDILLAEQIINSREENI